jgi:hypothetical protein
MASAGGAAEAARRVKETQGDVYRATAGENTPQQPATERFGLNAGFIEEHN